MINIKDILFKLFEIIIFGGGIFGFNIVFRKNSDTPTTIVGCILLGMSITLLLFILNII